MKTKISYSLLAAAMACGMSQAQTTAYTTPVGYLTAPLAGNADSNVSGAATFVSATLVQPAEFAGAATASPSGGTLITFAGGVPATFDGKYVLEISDGAQEGWWSTVVSSNATSITVADPFPASLASNVRVSVRKFNTVKSLFGSNTPGLTPFDGGASQADEIVFLEPGGGVTIVVYLPEAISGEPDKWFDFVGGVSADDYIIYPGTAVKVTLYGAGAKSLVSSGEVKVTNTQTDVLAEENWLGVPIAANGTLGNMNFFPQLVAFDAGTTPNDVLETLGGGDSGQGTIPYVALSTDLGGGFMLDFVGGTDASNVSLPAGTGYVLKRDPSQNPSILTIPAQTIGN